MKARKKKKSVRWFHINFKRVYLIISGFWIAFFGYVLFTSETLEQASTIIIIMILPLLPVIPYYIIKQLIEGSKNIKFKNIKKHSKSILIVGVLGVIAFVGWNLFFAGSSSSCSSWKSKDKWTNCFGKDEMANGVYEGHYLNGKFDGQGAFTFADGNKYVGDFKDGGAHGPQGGGGGVGVSVI